MKRKPRRHAAAAGRQDGNARPIVDTFLAFGASWADLHMVGGGVADGLLGYAGQNELVEIKTPKGTFTKAQKVFRATWHGRPPIVVRSMQDALDLLSALRAK